MPNKEKSRTALSPCESSGLCSLCDTKIAIISFSSLGNAFIGVHLSVDAAIDHYLGGSATNVSGFSDEDKKLIIEIEELELQLKREAGGS